jgi:hypothetical protein
MPVQRRTYLGHGLVDRNLLGRGPRRYPGHLTIQIRFLITRGHPARISRPHCWPRPATARHETSA